MALPPIDGVSRINRVTMVDAVTKRPLENYPWAPSAAPASDLSKLAADAGLSLGDKGWSGFVSHIKGPVVEGQLYSYVLDVTLEKGTTSEKLAAALRSQGIIATGSANPDGSLDLRYLHLMAFGQGNLEIQESAKPGERGHERYGRN